MFINYQDDTDGLKEEYEDARKYIDDLLTKVCTRNEYYFQKGRTVASLKNDIVVILKMISTLP